MPRSDSDRGARQRAARPRAMPSVTDERAPRPTQSDDAEEIQQVTARQQQRLAARCTPWSFPKATIEPVNVTAPMKTPMNVSTS